MKQFASFVFALAFALAPLWLASTAGAHTKIDGDPPGDKPPVTRPPCCRAGGVLCLFGSAAPCEVFCEPCACQGGKCILGFPIAATCMCI